MVTMTAASALGYCKLATGKLEGNNQPAVTATTSTSCDCDTEIKYSRIAISW